MSSRLPTSVVPSRYDLTLYPDLKASHFRGDMVISVDVVEATSSIRLHSLELELDRVRISCQAEYVRLCVCVCVVCVCVCV
jgi:hypothetical protein